MSVLLRVSVAVGGTLALIGVGAALSAITGIAAPWALLIVLVAFAIIAIPMTHRQRS